MRTSFSCASRASRSSFALRLAFWAAKLRFSRRDKSAAGRELVCPERTPAWHEEQHQRDWQH